MWMFFRCGKCLYIQKDNHSKELKYNQTQPNSTEPMKMSGLEYSEANQEPWSDQLLDRLSPLRTCAGRGLTFEMEVKGSGGTGAAGNTTCWRNTTSLSSWLARTWITEQPPVWSLRHRLIVLKLYFMFSIARTNLPHRRQKSFSLTSLLFFF